MIDYKNGKIYRIIDNTSEMVYIGSTCQTLTQRLAGHVRDFNRFKSGKTHYVSAFKII